MFESAKAFLQFIGIIAYVICGLGFQLIVIVALSSVAPLNVLAALSWWLPVLYVSLKEDNRRAIAEVFKHGPTIDTSDERRREILEDIERKRSRARQF